MEINTSVQDPPPTGSQENDTISIASEMPQSSMPTSTSMTFGAPSSSRMERSPMKRTGLVPGFDHAKLAKMSVIIEDFTRNPSKEIQKSLQLLPCVQAWFKKKYNEGLEANIVDKDATIDRLRRERNNMLTNIEQDHGRYDQLAAKYNEVLADFRILKAKYDEAQLEAIRCTCRYENERTGDPTLPPYTPTMHQTSGSTSYQPEKQQLVSAGPFDTARWTDVLQKCNFLEDECTNNWRLHARTKQEIRATITTAKALNHADKDQDGVIDAADGVYRRLQDFCHLTIGGKQQMHAATRQAQATAAGVTLPPVVPHVTVNYARPPQRGGARGRSSRGSGRAGRSGK